MKREIKFRLWNPASKSYLWDVENVYECLMQQLVFNGAETRGFTSPHDHISDGLVWEQFTGLTDKNGKEIYEGDICIMHMPTTWGDDGELSKEVDNRVIYFEWKNNGWYLKGFKHLYGSFYFGGITGEILEVIGNIHENPELL